MTHSLVNALISASRWLGSHRLLILARSREIHSETLTLLHICEMNMKWWQLRKRDKQKLAIEPVKWLGRGAKASDSRLTSYWFGRGIAQSWPWLYHWTRPRTASFRISLAKGLPYGCLLKQCTSWFLAVWILEKDWRRLRGSMTSWSGVCQTVLENIDRSKEVFPDRIVSWQSTGKTQIEGTAQSSEDREGESTAWWRAELVVFSCLADVSWRRSKFGGIIPFALLHRVHSCFHIVVIAVELFLGEFLAFCQLTKGFIHAFHFSLTLEAFPMFAAHIASNCVENTLETISPRYFSLVL